MMSFKSVVSDICFKYYISTQNAYVGIMFLHSYEKYERKCFPMSLETSIKLMRVEGKMKYEFKNIFITIKVEKGLYRQPMFLISA